MTTLYIAIERGSLMTNTATSPLGARVAVGFLAWQLRRHATSKVACQ